MENICFQCKQECVGPSNRLVQDTCGHKKCRKCLLSDEEKCKQCTEKEIKENFIVPENVIKCETGVIKCNGNLSEKKLSLPTSSTTSNDKLRKSNTKNKRPYKPISIPSHITMVIDPLMYNCSICNKSFTTKAHVKYHTYCAGVKPHKCEICNKEFVLKTHFDVHMMKHNGAKPHKCNICQKSFSERSKLSRHLKLHTTVKPYVCAECGNAYRSKESLRLHSIIHKGEKPYACKLCSARFNHSSNLNKHLASHSAEKVHMCDQCGKRFKLKWALSVHRRSHLPVRQFECGMCSKAFVNNKDLQRHSLVHAETKGFTCSICNTSFRRKDNLNRHLKNTHPGKKGEVIKNIVNKPTVVHRIRPVDNPNAVNVIKSPPGFTRKLENPPVKIDSRPSTVINGPIKLAFKTPAFKNNYNINIQRDFDGLLKYAPSPATKKPYDLLDPGNIYQKILSPQSPPPSRNSDMDTSPLSQKILSNNTPLHYETSFQNRKHAMIKNIKFKVPIQYTQNTRKDEQIKEPLNDIVPLKPVMVNEEMIVNGNTNNNTYTELKTVPNSSTSVIVNAVQPNNVHWRRRISQNLNLNC